MLLYHAYSALADFRGILRYLLHGSILSEVGASTKPGAVQPADLGSVRLKSAEWRKSGEKTNISMGVIAHFLTFDGRFVLHSGNLAVIQRFPRVVP